VPKKKKEETRRPNSPLTRKVTMLMPDQVALRLKKQAADEGCSMSWIVTALVMDELEMKPSMLKGHRPPKYFKDRVGGWTPNKKKKEEAREETTEEKSAEEETREMLEFHCASCGVHVRTWKHSPSKEAQDIIKSGLCMKCYAHVTNAEGGVSSGK